MQLSNLVRSVNKTNYYYIIVNIAISIYSFLRSFVFMRVLDLRELGIISLVQTIFMFIGLLQCGLLNGGYRIVSLGKKEELEKTNNTIFSYVILLLPIGLLFCIFSSIFNWIKDLTFLLLILAVVFGIFTLVNNWLHNALIGEQKLSEVNRINIVSNGVALIFLPLAFVWGFWGALVVLVIQPLLFVTLCLWRNKELRPTGFFFNIGYIRYILSFGFIPFLGGIFVALYLQVERWSITDILGVEALGAFYLVFLYVSLYQLVPTSINAIFFPKGVKSYSDRDFNRFKRILKYYYFVLIGYGALIAVITFTLLEPIVSVVFPNHLPGVLFVYIILPGLVMQSLSEPIGLVLNASVILKPMLIVSVLNFLVCVAVVALLIMAGTFKLENVAIVRTISGCFLLISYIITYLIIKKNLYNNERKN